MVWTAALYLTASPRNGSSSPMCVLAVLHAASAAHPNASMSARLKDMAVILLESDRLLLRHAPGWRRQRRRRSDEWSCGGRHAGVRAPVEQKVGFIGRPDAVGRHLERA